MNNLVEVYKNVLRVSHRIVAENTNNMIKSVQNLITGNIKELEEFGRVHFKNETLKTNGGMQETKTYYLNEQQATLLLTFMKNSRIVKQFKIKLIKEFYRMKAHIKKETPLLNEKVQTVIYCLDNAIKHLNANNKTKLVMMKKAYESLGVNTRFLPNDVEEPVAYSLTELLQKHNVDMSVQQFNPLLIKHGIVKSVTRTTSTGFKQTYKVITEKGLRYGKNSVKTNTFKGVQPHYYEHTFKELLELVLD